MHATPLPAFGRLEELKLILREDYGFVSGPPTGMVQVRPRYSTPKRAVVTKWSRDLRITSGSTREKEKHRHSLIEQAHERWKQKVGAFSRPASPYPHQISALGTRIADAASAEGSADIIALPCRRRMHRTSVCPRYPQPQGEEQIKK